MEKKEQIRIYVACLASYIDGIVHGEWIDAAQGQEGIWRDVSQMLLRSPAEYAEEWIIQDYVGFGCLELSEHCDLGRLAAAGTFIQEHGALGAKLVAYFRHIDDAKIAITERYIGQYNSVGDYAKQLTEETTQIPESLRYYVDYEKMARDLEINDVLAIQTGQSVHVFWRH